VWVTHRFYALFGRDLESSFTGRTWVRIESTSAARTARCSRCRRAGPMRQLPLLHGQVGRIALGRRRTGPARPLAGGPHARLRCRRHSHHADHTCLPNGGAVPRSISNSSYSRVVRRRDGGLGGGPGGHHVAGAALPDPHRSGCGTSCSRPRTSSTPGRGAVTERRVSRRGGGSPSVGSRRPGLLRRAG
jgi:hypothetical protein